jgi:hypothetical protein
MAAVAAMYRASGLRMRCAKWQRWWVSLARIVELTTQGPPLIHTMGGPHVKLVFIALKRPSPSSVVHLMRRTSVSAPVLGASAAGRGSTVTSLLAATHTHARTAPPARQTAERIRVLAVPAGKVLSVMHLLAVAKARAKTVAHVRRTVASTLAHVKENGKGTRTVRRHRVRITMIVGHTARAWMSVTRTRALAVVGISRGALLAVI